MTDDQHTPVISKSTALIRGFFKRCPNCGDGSVFRAFLKPVDACSVCAEPYSHIRADDFPPYLTIVLVGHIIVPLELIAEKMFVPPIWVHMVLWLPLTIGLMLWFLPRLKGMVLAWMWMLGLTGTEHQGVEPGA